MSMAYFASFDTRLVPAGNVALTKAGGGTVYASAHDLDFVNGFGNRAYLYNHAITSGWAGMDYGASAHLKTFSPYTFCQALARKLRTGASFFGWPSPSSLDIEFDPSSRRVRFVYPTGITAITFDNATLRGLLGFTANFSGTSTAVTGLALPSHIIEPTTDGASSASVVYETAPVSSLAYSATGQSFAIARTQAPLRRRWVQQYESLQKTFRRQADASIPYTFEDLWGDCRSGLPFAVVDGFVDDALTAYCLERGFESFHPLPATPGNASMFHIPFQTVALGRYVGAALVDALLYDGTGDVLTHTDGTILLDG
jgi:hypothetical protein